MFVQPKLPERTTFRNQGKRTIGAKSFAAEFVGSFYELAQLPRDRRPQIALAGRSNVGKSSLLNRLVGQKNIAKVSSTPGKTRALNFFTVNDRFYLVDLPGYGYAKVAKTIKAGWGKLIEDYLVKGPYLAGLVLLIDCRREPMEDDLTLLGWLAEREIPALVVVTKVDKLNRDQALRKVRQTETELGAPTLAFSIKTGEGRLELMAAIRDVIETHKER